MVIRLLFRVGTVKRLNPDTVSPGAFNGVSARAAAWQDHSRPRLPPEPDGSDALRPPARGSSGQVTSGGPAHPWLDGRLDVKIKIQPEHASMLEINDWLGELQDGENAEPAGRQCRARWPRQCRRRPSMALAAGWPWPRRRRPAMSVPSQAPATPCRPAMTAPCRPALATPCRPALAAPGQRLPVPGQKPSPGPLLQPRPPRPLPPPGPLPLLSQPGPLPQPRPLARPGLRCGL